MTRRFYSDSIVTVEYETEDEEVKLRYDFSESSGWWNPDKCSFSKWASEGEVKGIRIKSVVVESN